MACIPRSSGYAASMTAAPPSDTDVLIVGAGIAGASLAAGLAPWRPVLLVEGGDLARYHAPRTRQAGARRFISFHILVPGDWTVQRGHDLLEEIEERIREAVPRSVVDTHLEPIEDPVSWADTRLVRPG